jgi:hypothetical protein
MSSSKVMVVGMQLAHGRSFDAHGYFPSTRWHVVAICCSIGRSQRQTTGTSLSCTFALRVEVKTMKIGICRSRPALTAPCARAAVNRGSAREIRAGQPHAKNRRGGRHRSSLRHAAHALTATTTRSVVPASLRHQRKDWRRNRPRRPAKRAAPRRQHNARNDVAIETVLAMRQHIVGERNELKPEKPC